MNYQTYQPCSELADLIKCYWSLDSPAEEIPERQTIVPDGCIEMIFHYGDLYKQYLDDSNTIIQPRSFVFGQITSPLDIEPTGYTNIFSVRFYPGGFLPFTTIPVTELENTAVPLQRLFGLSGIALEEKMLKQVDVNNKISVIEAFMQSKLSAIETVDRVVSSTVETMLTANGQLSVDELSRKTNINRRQLERKFSAAIGLSPKKLSKTIRLQATLKMLLNKNFNSLTDLAYENEYYDQAHFIKDFKEMTGYTPKEFYGDQLKMSSLFYGGEDKQRDTV